ncbi:hypothetical protein RHSIM_Rhsim02G0078300 [Rhododendron simsii]|uniref:Rx N-terminal domain-containing protein n=1 Tax=Rhododendron simsii TaxID=118357 RepID=A0A834HAW8_RHOSS|nr:hypothetical protein RHSIM_Rhsim02G0078300 [Rhododendron simsii]
MALVAVSSVINSTLVPLLSGEVKLLRNIHTEVASIKAELESIISFLKDADSSPKLENERAKNWVKQVRALAYQIKDVMDEYILHLAENRQRRGFIGFLRELARSITKLKPQHDIASQIQDIKTNIVHEIMVAKCEELSFCQVLGEADQSWNNETRRWSMHMRNITNNDLETISSTKSRIRSIFLFSMGEIPKELLLGTLVGNFKLLKVLDFEDAPLDHLHEDMGNLLHLRYLSVKRTKVKIIPKSIGNLHNLQTLNLKDSQVYVLQIGILSKLRKLRHLIAACQYMEIGLEIRGGIGHLKELQTLWGVEANDDLIKELKKLRQLRKFGITNLKQEHCGALFTAIEKMNHLQSLRVKTIHDDELLDLQFLSPPESLQHLYLRGHLESLPNCISSLSNIRGSGLTGVSAIKALQALPNLTRLDLFHWYDKEQLYFDVRGFPKLKLLSLRFLKGLNSVIIEEGGLPVLNMLWIEDCPQLKKVPSSIRNLRELKSLYFEDMPTELLDRMQPGKGQDYWVIAHIPDVKFFWTGGGRKPKWYTPREFQDVRESQRLNDT